jgi:hypothetical protein
MIGGGQDTATTTPPEEWRQLVHEGADEGARNAAIARLAGHLLRRFIDPYLTLDLLLSWNTTHCKPPLTESEVARTVDSVARAESRRRRGGAVHG